MSERINPFRYSCTICNGPAKGFFFGVRSCASCKTFFRRNAEEKEKIFQCAFNGQCEINVNTRHRCATCRLAKCFACGMKIELFRCPRTAISQSKRIPTLNLLQSDSSTLTTDQWTLLSNLIHIYQESELIAISHRFIRMTDQSLIEQFLLCTYQTTGKYLRLNADLCQLPSNDRSIMLRTAADHVSCMGCSFVMNHCHLLQMKGFIRTLQGMYGEDTMDIHRWIARFIDPDIILVKLALNLFALMENTYVYRPYLVMDLTNSIHILNIQNKYAEITWKYLLYRYGFDHAVKRFVNLTSWLSAVSKLMCHVQNLSLHVNDVDSLVEQTEIDLILDDG